jgi:hypothetical protein
MSSNLKEKLDYIWPHIDSLDILIDFGCANGSTTEVMASMYPETLFIGIDLKDVIDVNKKYNDHFSNIVYMTLDEYDNKFTQEEGKKLGVIYSSVTHEIFSTELMLDSATGLKTKTKENINNALDYLFRFDADIIFIRDMFCPYEFDINPDIVSLKKQYLVDEDREFDSRRLVKFEQSYGIKTNKDYIHYLLKARYPDNFESELEEDYFATEWNQIIYGGLDAGYKKIYDKEYMNNYLDNAIKSELDENIIQYTHVTHRKIILSRL